MSGWHGAIPDHHDAAVVAWALVSPEQPRSPEMDLHTAAHAVTGMWADSASRTFVSPMAFKRQAAWLVRVDSFVRGGILEALLRPPKG